MFLRTSLAFLLFGFLNEFECVIVGPTGSSSPNPTTKNSRNGSPSAVVETTSKQHRIAETAPSNSHKRDAKSAITLPRTRQSLSSSTNSQSRPKYLPILIRSKSNQTNTSAKSSSTAAEMRNSEQNSPPRKQWTTSIKSEEKEKVFGQIRGAVEKTKNEKDEWMEETIGDGEGIHQWTRSDVNSSVVGKSISSHSTTSESNK